MPTAVLPTLQGAPKDGFGEAVTACDMHEPYLLSLLAVHANIFTYVCAVGHDLPLFCADFHSIYRCSIYWSVDEVLKFTIAANHKTNVISKSLVAYEPSTNGDGCVVVMECFLHDLL